MRIAQVAPIYLPVPPPGRGGIELMVSYLTEELVRRGHEVTLFASGDSQTHAILDAVEPTALTLRPDFAAEGPAGTRRRTQAHIGHALRRATNFDIIHGHFNADFPTFTVDVTTPAVMTYHMPINPVHHCQFVAETPCHFVSLSRSQQAGLPGFAGIAPNGIPVEKIPFQAAPGEGLVFVGRMATKKGPHHAIAVAKETGLPLTLIGKSYPNIRAYWQYFQEQVRPHVDGQHIRHIEELSNAETLAQMGRARAFLMPIEWEEPFGLVMIEAMATGTPVIAFRRGSVPEVVQDGVTGFIVDTVDEMVAAVKKIDMIDRAACRRWVEEHFTVSHMVDAYETIYQKILAAGPRQYA